MRLLLFCAAFLPVCAFCQANRSATQFTQESIDNYITHKVFPGKTYKPLLFGILEGAKDRENFKISWKMEHRFQILENNGEEPKNYRFIFFMGKRMNIITVDAAYTE